MTQGCQKTSPNLFPGLWHYSSWSFSLLYTVDLLPKKAHDSRVFGSLIKNVAIYLINEKRGCSPGFGGVPCGSRTTPRFCLQIGEFSDSLGLCVSPLHKAGFADWASLVQRPIFCNSSNIFELFPGICSEMSIGRCACCGCQLANSRFLLGSQSLRWHRYWLLLDANPMPDNVGDSTSIKWIVLDF